MYVLQTDAPCLRCGEEHGYVTQWCDLVVFVDWETAAWVGAKIEGSAVRPIHDVPQGLSYTLYLHKKGRPATDAPKTRSTLPRS